MLPKYTKMICSSRTVPIDLSVSYPIYLKSLKIAESVKKVFLEILDWFSREF